MRTPAQLIENIPTETVEQLRKQIYGLLKENVGGIPRDPEASPQDKYNALKEHHVKETEFLIALLIKWGNTVQGLDRMLTEEQRKNDSPT